MCIRGGLGEALCMHVLELLRRFLRGLEASTWNGNEAKPLCGMGTRLVTWLYCNKVFVKSTNQKNN